MSGASLAEWLRRLGDDELAALLERRPDVVTGPPPSTLGQLANRLSHPESLVAALRGLSAPGLQVVEALQALGERRTRTALIGLLDGRPGPQHERAVDAALADASAAALVWPGEGNRLLVPSGLAQVLPAPLGLGPPARLLWTDRTVDEIGRAARALGGRPEGRKADKLENLLSLLAEPERIRTLATQAPPAIAAALRRMAGGGMDDEDEFYDFDRFDPEIYLRQREAERWAVDNGLLAGDSWGSSGPLPAEVGLALRGPDFRAPFTPRPPSLLTRAVAPKTVDAAAAAAITSFLAHAVALLDRLTRAPVPQLAGGGVGIRELGRLAKELRVEETELRLLLALADAGGLLHAGGDGLGVSDRFEGWRSAEPQTQAGSLLSAWWGFPSAATQTRDAGGKALPALRVAEPCAGCEAARLVVVQVVAALPAGTAAWAAELADLARWHRPMVHVLPQDADAPLRTVLREAELLGVVAAGAVSALGTALVEDDVDALLGHLGRMLPAVSDTAAFGSDLTAMVPGTPSAQVTVLLDSCADRESSGGAVTWRFSPASVRRALDAGTTAELLVERLAAIAGRELPQPLTYLIGDVGRRHGRLRLLPAVSLIRSDDEALLAEVAADRRLAALGLQLVAPTVVACQTPLDAALARLREVGYFPVEEAASSTPRAGAAGRPRTDSGRTARSAPPRPRPVAAPAAVEPRVLAERLAAGGDVSIPIGSHLAVELARTAHGLAPDEIDRLADAVEAGGRLRIHYRSASGALTRRVIQDPELDGDMLYAWCELRQDQRVFALSRILSVAAPG